MSELANLTAALACAFLGVVFLRVAVDVASGGSRGEYRMQITRNTSTINAVEGDS